MRKAKNLKKVKCKKCGGTKTTKDYTDGTREIVMWRLPNCLHRWELIEEIEFCGEGLDEKENL